MRNATGAASCFRDAAHGFMISSVDMMTTCVRKMELQILKIVLFK
jgi:hypothetical protein